ncbi:MAG: hypothetical protein F6K42_36345 [Leptolyngbya sp. SIO1D8]|nr:hypothetical protein [Leptolyngbya sp. SIO1D8]
MRWVKKIVAGLLLIWGMPISLMAIVNLVNPQTAAEDKEGALAALAIFGLPPIALGGWLVFNLRQNRQALLAQEEQELEQLFLQIIQDNKGVVTLVTFATQTNLSLEASKTYLDEKAIQLNGLYEVSEAGGIVYRFPL